MQKHEVGRTLFQERQNLSRKNNGKLAALQNFKVLPAKKLH